MLDRNLDDDLAAARRDLVEKISIPELDAIRDRAVALRRFRRRSVAAAVAALVVVGGTGTALRGAGWLHTTGVDVGSTPPTTPRAATQWTGGGVTVTGLTGMVNELPGDLRRVEFADPLRGYALAASCAPGGDRCALAMATTTDGGKTWTTPDWLTPPAEAGVDGVPALLAVGSGVALIGTRDSWIAGGPSWGFMRTGRNDGSTGVIGPGARLLAGATSGDRCDPSPVELVQPNGWRGQLTEQPGLQVCRVAPAPAADGSWWVAGRAGDRPAVAVTRDDGRTWQVVALTQAAPGSWALVTTLGDDVFAAVVSRSGGSRYPEALTVHAIYRSRAGGPFETYLGTGSGATVIGDVVPVRNGGLLAAGPGWQVSAGPGRAFTRLDDRLPFVYRLERTPGAWVAYDLFDAGWAAVSYDGATWQKIDVH